MMLLIRWHGAQRGRALGVRVVLALMMVCATFAIRVMATQDPLGLGRDLLLLGVLLAALLFGLAPGLCAAVLARGLSIWWYVGPNGEALVPPWHVPGIAVVLMLAVIAAALAGQTLQLLVQPEAEEETAALLGGRTLSRETEGGGGRDEAARAPRTQPAAATSR